MRITHKGLDEVLKGDVESCLADMGRVGVNPDPKDKLVAKACEIYCKWQFDYMNKGEQYKNDYLRLRDALSMSQEHKVD